MLTGGETVTVTVIRPPARGRHGDPVSGDPVEFDIPGGLFAPGPSVEMLDGANQLVADGAWYGPADADVRPTDRMRIRGDLYEVDGKPQNWGATWGLVVPLKLVTG